MASEKFLPGFWSKFWSWFKIANKPGKGATGKMVYQGEDLNGNNYFESVDKHGRLLRVVEPKKFQSDDMIPMIPEIIISPEWIRWLRKTCEEPPTEEEMIRNAAIAYLKKQRASELESEERKNWPQLDAKLKQLEAEKDYHPISLFPLYRDLMVNPGQEYMINRGFYVPDLNENIQLESQQQYPKLSSGDDNNRDSINQETSRQEPVKLESTKPDRSQIDCKTKSS